MLDLLADFNAKGRTLIAVLHDLDHACRYASHLIAMKDGRILAEGRPKEPKASSRTSSAFPASSRRSRLRYSHNSAEGTG